MRVTITRSPSLITRADNISLVAMSRFESSARKLFPLRSRNFTASVLILLFERGRSMVIRLEMARMKDDRSDDQFIKNALRDESGTIALTDLPLKLDDLRNNMIDEFRIYI